MKKKKNEEIIEVEPPQKSLERILKTEIQVAQKISAAKESAEHAINDARDEVGILKENILKDAREDRERMISDGIDKANKKAKKNMEKAGKNSASFYESGLKFIDLAVDDVIHIVLDDKDESK